MNYDASSLTTVADCDALLTMVTRDKENLQFKRTLLEHAQTIYSNSSLELGAELDEVLLDLASLPAKIAAMPEGKNKREAMARQKKLEWRQALITNKQYNYGSVARLENLLELFHNEQEIAAKEEFILAVAARKAAL